MRYRQFFRCGYFKLVPTQMLFLNLPRYPHSGCRWIPTPLLDQSTPQYTALSGDEYRSTSREAGIPLNLGLTAKYAGFTLTGDCRNVILTGTFRVHLGTGMYYARVYEAGTMHPPRYVPLWPLAIVVPRSFHESTMAMTAILVSIRAFQYSVDFSKECFEMIFDKLPLFAETEPARPANACSMKLSYRQQQSLRRNLDRSYNPPDRLTRRRDELTTGSEMYHSCILAQHEALVDFRRLGHGQGIHLTTLQAQPIHEPRDDYGYCTWIIG